MSEELNILKILADNPSISQRKIAKQTGISLGQVNFIIKKCVKKGLVKIEGQTTKSIKYNLTPKGMSEKAARMLQYIKVSYGAVSVLTNKIKTLEEQYNAAGKDIFVYGDEDEMMDIIKLSLGNINMLTEVPINAVVFYWDNEKIKNIQSECSINNIKCINILE